MHKRIQSSYSFLNRQIQRPLENNLNLFHCMQQNGLTSIGPEFTQNGRSLLHKISQFLSGPVQWVISVFELVLLLSRIATYAHRPQGVNLY